MNKNVVTTIIIFFAVVVGLIWIVPPSNKQDKNLANSGSVLGGVFSVEESNFDFGTISMAAGKVSHMFKIKNSGSVKAEISKIYTSCMCTSASLIKGSSRKGPFGMPGHGFIPKINESFNPNEEAEVEVVFDPAAHGPAGIGKIERLVTIEVENGSPVEFMFSAFVKP